MKTDLSDADKYYLGHIVQVYRGIYGDVLTRNREVNFTFSLRYGAGSETFEIDMDVIEEWYDELK